MVRVVVMVMVRVRVRVWVWVRVRVRGRGAPCSSIESRMGGERCSRRISVRISESTAPDLVGR